MVIRDLLACGFCRLVHSLAAHRGIGFRSRPRDIIPLAARHPLVHRRLLMLLSISLGSIAHAVPAHGDTTAEPAYDQVMARIPGDTAGIAPVALAQLNIALHRAKKQAATALCKGSWLPDGEIVQQLGPLPVILTNYKTVWIYQVARRPVPLACEQASRAQFFQEMSRHLPAWVSIRPAGGLTTYRLGVAEPLPHPRLASH